MRLLNASRYFDDTVIRDAYSNAYLFKGQVAAYIDSQVDGTIARRRVISLAPNLTIPNRRALKYGSEVWIVGNGVSDHLQGHELRKSYMAKKSTELFSIKTPGQAALVSTGVTAYGQSDYLKSTVNSQTDSNYDGQYEITFSTSETINPGTILTQGSRYFSVRGKHTLLEGFIVAEADELDTGNISMVFSGMGAYDPVTDTYATATVTTTGILADRYKIYQHRTESDPLSKAGDMSILVASSAIIPLVGHQVSALGDWVIEEVLPYQDAWLCHVRRA